MKISSKAENRIEAIMEIGYEHAQISKMFRDRSWKWQQFKLVSALRFWSMIFSISYKLGL